MGRHKTRKRRGGSRASARRTGAHPIAEKRNDISIVQPHKTRLRIATTSARRHNHRHNAKLHRMERTHKPDTTERRMENKLRFRANNDHTQRNTHSKPWRQTHTHRSEQSGMPNKSKQTGRKRSTLFNCRHTNGRLNTTQNETQHPPKHGGTSNGGSSINGSLRYCLAKNIATAPQNNNNTQKHNTTNPWHNGKSGANVSQNRQRHKNTKRHHTTTTHTSNGKTRQNNSQNNSKNDDKKPSTKMDGKHVGTHNNTPHEIHTHHSNSSSIRQNAQSATFYAYYQIGTQPKPNETQSEPKTEGELKTEVYPPHSPFGFVYQIMKDTHLTPKEIIHQIPYTTLMMMIADQPKIETTKQTTSTKNEAQNIINQLKQMQ